MPGAPLADAVALQRFAVIDVSMATTWPFRSATW
jgi:hypothetical protein